jgi:hypothetical protein
MPKKVTIVAATLMLLLATAQLAVAQQDLGTSTEQQDASQTQPAGEAQAASPSLEGAVHLNENSNLVVNCAGVSEGLAQLQQLGDAQASDPQFQSTLAQAEMLAQLCASYGYAPPSAG